MSRTVLIVEDGLADRVELTTACEEAGFQPIPCATAAAARQALGRARVNAVVLAGELPDGDGVDLLREIRSTPWGRALPVVMLSSSAETSDRARLLERGADEYVLTPCDARDLMARVARLAGGPRPAGGTTILVIEDSPTFRLLIAATLEEAGYAVLEAETGEDGLQMAGARRPDALVVDGVLPGIDGPTVIRRIRLDAALRDLPCLLLTSSEDRDAELQALDAGADAFVRKQDDLAVILARIAAMLRTAPSRPHPADETRSLSGFRTILLAADLPWLAGLLTGDGYDVIPARSGQELLDALAARPVDCILVDSLLPDLGGQETCARIKAVPALRDVPLIMLIAAVDQEATLEALRAGADDCMSTSSEPTVVMARVRAQIRRKQFEDENRRIREALLRRELEAVEARAARELAETKALLVDELERKNRELEAFSYSVSHDLRAPLRAIDGFSRVVLEDFGDSLPPEGRSSLQRVCAAAQRMGGLIDALLDLSRVGRAHLRFDRLDLSAIARDTVADLRRRSVRQVTVVIQDDLVADADGRLIRIVLENLLGNSWKFTAPVTDAIVEFGSEQSEEGRTYYVRDNGAGFDMAYAEKLFRPFQRLHADAEFAGTGIGLATVYRIIDRHGGRVWAEGRVGHGATFAFTLPAHPRGGLL